MGDGFNVGGDCSEGTAYDISITDANIVAITGCRFNAIAGSNRVNIQINPFATPSQILAQRFLIAHNQFGDSSDGTFGISAVRIYSSASDIRIGDNHYIGAYSGPVIGDHTGTDAVAAMLGYPSSSATSPSAVVPNGGTTGIYPTLGSASAAWLASYSNGHFLPSTGSTTAPYTPVTGWAIFTDSSNNLMAQYKNNAPQLLLHHP